MTLPWAAASGATNQQVYPIGLASYLAQVFGWDPSFGIASDPEYIEKITRDTACSGALDHLQKLIVGHDFFYEPAGSSPLDVKLANLLTELQKQTKNLPQTWYNLASATWKGAAWGRIKLARRVLRIGDGQPRIWTVVDEVKDVDKRRFRLSRADTRGPHATDATGRPPAGRNDGFKSDWHWEFHRGWASDGMDAPSTWSPLEETAPLEEWLQFVIDTSERGLAYGWGLGEDLFFNLFAKTKVMRSLLQGIDRWGQGFLVQFVEGLREGGADGFTPEQKIALAVQALRKYRSENVYALDKSDDLKLLDGPAGAIDACLQLIQYFDKENRIRILSAVETTGGGDGDGGFSKAKVEEGSEDANVAFSRSPLEERWTRSVTRLLVVKNRKNLLELGFPEWLQVSRLRLRGRKTSDPEKAGNTLRTARELGLPVLRKEAYSMLELTQPNSETKPEDVLDWKNLAAQDPAVEARLDRTLAQGGEAEQTPVGEGGSSVAESPAAEGRPEQEHQLVGAGTNGVAQE